MPQPFFKQLHHSSYFIKCLHAIKSCFIVSQVDCEHHHIEFKLHVFSFWPLLLFRHITVFSYDGKKSSPVKLLVSRFSQIFICRENVILVVLTIKQNQLQSATQWYYKLEILSDLTIYIYVLYTSDSNAHQGWAVNLRIIFTKVSSMLFWLQLDWFISKIYIYKLTTSDQKWQNTMCSESSPGAICDVH